MRGKRDVPRDTDELAGLVIERHGLKTIEDVVQVIPSHMCHVTQEPEVFGTWPNNIVRFRFPKEEWDERNANYARYRDEVIPSLSLVDYLRAFVEADGERLPCFCTEMSEVAGTLVSVMLGRPVYAVRNIYVNYLYLPQRWHALNALVTDGRIRYFDSSAYRQLFDRSRRRFMRPQELDGFDAADVDPRFIVSDNWLQTEPFARTIAIEANEIRDNFYPNPLDATRPDDYLRVYGARQRSAFAQSDTGTAWVPVAGNMS
jgi:hypothetical protein